MTLGDVGVVISCVGHLHSNSWRANLFEVRPLIINSFYFPHFKAALMLFEVRSLFGVLGYFEIAPTTQWEIKQVRVMGHPRVGGIEVLVRS